MPVGAGAIIGGAAVGSAGNIFGTLIGNRRARKEGKKQRKFNREEARKTRNFNRQEANRARSWQEQMSNTAYRRGAHDLEQAGLNRILALGTPATSGGGASGSAGAASAGIPSQSSIDFGDPVSTAMNIKSTMAQIENTRQATQTSSAQESKLETDTLAQYYKNERLRIEHAIWKQTHKTGSTAKDVYDSGSLWDNTVGNFQKTLEQGNARARKYFQKAGKNQKHDLDKHRNRKYRRGHTDPRGSDYETFQNEWWR